MLSERSLEIARILAGAASIAQRFYGKVHADLKSDHSLVTEADRAVEAYVFSELEKEEAGIRVIGEETFAKKSAAYMDAALRGKTYIIDPIDGTAMYAHQIPVWGCILGYAENGVLQEGGCVIPETGEMLLSSEGKTYYASDRTVPFDEWDFNAVLKPLDPPDPEFTDRSLLCISQEIAHSSAALRLHNVANAFCSSCYLAVLLATGRTAGAIHNAKLWDYAGILPPLKNLGFVSIPFRGQGDLLSLRIGAENYNQDYASLKAFATVSTFALARTEETARRIIAGTTLPGGACHG